MTVGVLGFGLWVKVRVIVKVIGFLLIAGIACIAVIYKLIPKRLNPNRSLDLHTVIFCYCYMVFSFVSPFSSLSCFPFRLDIARYAFDEMVAIQRR